MVTVHEPATIDTDKLMSFVFRAVDEVGATLNTALVVMGDKLGLYRALAGAGPSARPSWPVARAFPNATLKSGSMLRPPGGTWSMTQTAGATYCLPNRPWP